MLHPPCSAQVSYEGLGVEMVLECTGVFLTREKLAPYFAKGVKKVVVSAPVKDPEPVLNIVVGCNEVRRAGASERAPDPVLVLAPPPLPPLPTTPPTVPRDP